MTSNIHERAHLAKAGEKFSMALQRFFEGAPESVPHGDKRNSEVGVG